MTATIHQRFGRGNAAKEPVGNPPNLAATPPEPHMDLRAGRGVAFCGRTLKLPSEAMMAWIRTISEQEAEGPLGELYAKLRQNPHFGMVPNVIKAFSLRPEIAAAITRLSSAATFGGSHLSRVQEEMIAAAVSSVNRCHY
jgi:alkylhydroperoxidase family enzyme